MKKVLSVFLSIILISTVFCSCSSNSTTRLYYPFDGNINSYDPQIASTSDEFLLIENVFEGLVRVDDDGTVRAGVAKTWDISSDGLTYTFHLRQGAKWNISSEIEERMGEKYNPEITADDFVFALQRATQKATDSPLYSTISCIKNAPKIHSGKLDSSKLGVTAVDNYTLQIVLSGANDAFLETMSTAVGMPCNRLFFEATNGRYGLESKYTLFNGQYYLSLHLDTSYTLKLNDSYVGDYPANINSITLSINTDNDDVLDKLVSGTYDVAFIDGTGTDSFGKKSNISVTPYVDTTWSIIFNCKEGLFANKIMREAFCKGLSDIDVSGIDYLQTASGIVPPSCTIGTTSYREIAKNVSVKKDQKKSVELWKEGLKQISATSTDITIVTTDEMKDYLVKTLNNIFDGIGNVTSFTDSNGDTNEFQSTIKVESYTADELQDIVTTGDYQIAFFPFKTQKSSPVAFLSENADNKFYTGLNSTDFNIALKKAVNNSGKDDLTSLYTSCEKELLNTYAVCPVFFESSYYAASDAIEGIQFHPGSGRVNFTNAKIKN